MSNTPRLADECKRLLDNGYTISLYRNEMGSYTAIAVKVKGQKRRNVSADDFEPSQVLYRLTEKAFGVIV